MADCGCDKAKQALEEYLHNELCSEEAADIREHLEGCVDCTDEERVKVVLREAVQRACDETAPEDLRSQVMARLREVAKH